MIKSERLSVKVLTYIIRDAILVISWKCTRERTERKYTYCIINDKRKLF